MFHLKVVGLDEAEALIHLLWPTRIVSLMSTPVQNRGPHHLCVQVNDVPFVSQLGGSPSVDHLLQVLDFTTNLTDDDRLLVHCFAGQSRSTAMAIGICIQHGMNFQEAFDYVARIRSILMPNQLFIRIIDDHFQLQNKLVEYATAHRRTALQRTLILPSGPPPEKDVDDMKRLLKLMQGEP